MNDENEILNNETVPPQEAKDADSVKKRRSLREFLDGTVLTREVILGQLPFVLFVMFLALVYIANRYHSESIIRQINRVQNEIKDLRSEHISVSSDLMYLSKQSEVSRMAREKGLGLSEATKPPVKIIVSEK
jgi:cell division protein FtsL